MIFLRFPVLRIFYQNISRFVTSLIYCLDGDLFKMLLQIPQTNIQCPIGQIGVPFSIHINRCHAGKVIICLSPQKPPVHSSPEGRGSAVKAFDISGLFKNLLIVSGNSHIDGTVFRNLHHSGMQVVFLLQFIGDVLPVPIFLHLDLYSGKTVSCFVCHMDGHICGSGMPAGGRKDGNGHI